jgi:3-hydroxyacyl-[acyl-carrier-protein] dehydratase
VTAAAVEMVVHARQAVTLDDPYLHGHFPGWTVYPGVFTIEAVRQAAATALGTRADRAQFRELRSVRFLAPLLAGDELAIRAELRQLPDDGGFDVRAVVTRRDGVVAARLRGRLGWAAASGAEDPVADVPERSTLDCTAIRALLPHGHPMLLVDRVDRLVPGTELTSVKAVTLSEPCYRDVPVDAPADRYAYPLSLLIESFGQSAALLWLADRETAGLVPMFAALRDCRVEGMARPGDVLRHRVRLDHAVAGAAFATGETFAGGRRLATFGSIMAVTRTHPSVAEESR